MAEVISDRLSPHHVWQQRIIARFRANARGYWPAMRGAFLIFLAGILADAASTSWFIITNGYTHADEFNPIYRAQIASYGPLLGPLMGAYTKILSALIVTIYWRRFARAILMLTASISFFAAWYNVWGMNNVHVAPLVFRLLGQTG